MNLINFILNLVYRFVDFEPGEFEKIKAEGTRWYTDIQIHEGAELIEGQKLVLVKAKRINEFWASKLALAVIWIFAVRAIADYMNPKARKDEQDD